MYNKLKKYLIPFIIVWLFITHFYVDTIKLIKKCYYNNQKDILLSSAILLFIIPIGYSLFTDWVITGFYIFYDVIFGLCFLLWLIGSVDSNRSEKEGGYVGYKRYDNTEKTYGYNILNYYNPIDREKEKNGGFTDKEVIIKKQMIRKNLENKKFLEKEEIENQ